MGMVMENTLSVRAGKLIAQLKVVAKALPRRSAWAPPSWKSVCVELADGAYSLVCAGPFAHVKATGVAPGGGAFRVAVPAGALTAALAGAKKAVVHIAPAVGGGLSLQYGASSVRVSGEAGEKEADLLDFDAPAMMPGGRLVMPANVASKALGHVAPFVSKDVLQTGTRGVDIASFEQSVVFAATDMKTLSLFEAPQAAGATFSGILQEECLPVAKAILNAAKGSELVLQIATERQAAKPYMPRQVFCLSAGGYEARLGLYDSEYPNWRRVVSANSERSATFNMSELLGALAHAAPAASTHIAGTNMVVLEFVAGACTLYAPGTNRGIAFSVSLGCDYQAGNADKFSIAFDCKRLSAVLKTLGGDMVTLKMRSPDMAAMASRDTDDGRAMCLIMPLLISID